MIRGKSEEQSKEDSNRMEEDGSLSHLLDRDFVSLAPGNCDARVEIVDLRGAQRDCFQVFFGFLIPLHFLYLHCGLGNLSLQPAVISAISH